MQTWFQKSMVALVVSSLLSSFHASPGIFNLGTRVQALECERKNKLDSWVLDTHI